MKYEYIVQLVRTAARKGNEDVGSSPTVLKNIRCYEAD